MKRSFSVGLMIVLVITTAKSKSLYRSNLINKGAVVSNAPGCAQIGRDIMKSGGNVIDTVIATAFCEGVVNPSTMGIGGGFLTTIYNKTENKVWTFNARETAPALATEDMFVNNISLSESGGLSVAVPSEVRGYWYLYKNYGGGVPWQNLVEPTIALCEEGILMNELTQKNVEKIIETIRADPGLRAIFIDPKTDKVYRAGQLYKRPKLAQTLQIIAKEGGDALNQGSLTAALVNDIQENGGIITVKDLNEYEPEIREPVHTKIGDKNVYSIPPPGSGIILTYILNILENYINTNEQFSTLNYHRLAEVLKIGYEERGNLGDENFEEGVDELVAKLQSKQFAKASRFKINDELTFNDPGYYGLVAEAKEDHGTANICVWAPNGDGISLTSSINFIFGAGFASKSTDIILNNSMDDFSTPNHDNIYGYPPAAPNFIRPRKRPFSSMAPSIILDENNDLYMIVGGAGGSRIISSVAQVISNRLFFNNSVENSSNLKRIHHQLLPMNLFLEEEWSKDNEDIVLGLIKLGHNITFVPEDGFVAVTAISVDDENKSKLIAVHDKRRQGSVAYLE